MNKIEKLLKELCPNGVEYKALGEVCKLQNGFAFEAKKFKEQGNPIVRITNLQDDIIKTDSLVYFSFNDYENIDFSNYKILHNDILIAMSGATTGKVGIHKGKELLFLNQRVGKLKPNAVLKSKFLYYFLLTKVDYLYSLASGGAQPNLKTTDILSIRIPIPPLEIQEEIVKILDTFTELEAELEARKKQYEYYRNKLLTFKEAR